MRCAPQFAFHFLKHLHDRVALNSRLNFIGIPYDVSFLNLGLHSRVFSRFDYDLIGFAGLL